MKTIEIKKESKPGFMAQRKEEVKLVCGGVKDALDLLEAVSLVVVPVFGYLVLQGKVDPKGMAQWTVDAVWVAIVVIAVRGGWELKKYFVRKG